MARVVLKVLDGIVSFVIILALCLGGLYAGYALWDNNRVYAAAEDVQAQMQRLKPHIDPEAEDSGASFEELLAINPDVCAWVTLDNTNIDYPVLQGETNLSYINTDVYGEFALAGSIFLDANNNRDFTDGYSLLYGHHMDRGRMFGDLDLYKDPKFFSENRTGILILPDRAYDLEIYACLLVEASDDAIFKPTKWQLDIQGLLDYTKENALHVHDDVIARLRAEEAPQILGFSTCASEFTDARTILLAAMKPLTKSN